MAMNKTTRSDLLKTVETQQGQIEKYQTKLRDLIAAYKSVTKEKEALEASVKALSTAQTSTTQAKQDAEHEAANDLTESSFSDPLREKDANQLQGEEVAQLREQLATLTTALATLSQEKAKMEANYQAEKKTLKQDQGEMMEKSAKEGEKHQRLVSDLRAEVAEWRSQVMVQQHERDRERQESSTRIKELQKQLTQERAAIEALENQMEDMKEALSDAKQVGPDISMMYEDRISVMGNELKAVRDRLKSSEENASKPSPLLLRLQEEMAEIKAQNRISIQREQSRANAAEQQVQVRDAQAEERVASLEAKLSELSEVVGNYERLRFQDQTSIQKLRERVSQLDMENTALARAAHKGTSMDDTDSEDEANLDVQTLVDRMLRLKGWLKLANERSDKPVDIEELLRTGNISDDSQDSHVRCREEYDQLKEEFERYKLRAQSVLKNKSSSKDTGPKETDVLKAQLSEVKEKLRQVLEDQDQTNESQKKASDELRKTLTALQERHQSELTTQAGEYRSKMSELELEIRRHRDRTIALLSEKDKEIEALRSKLPEKYESQYVTSFRRMSSQASLNSDNVGSSHGHQAPQSLVEQEGVISELIKRTSIGTGASGTSETSILHFAQEQARKDVEINMLRKQKHSLEGALRELQRANAQKAESYQEKIEILEEHVRRLQRMTCKEDTANLEYLKNVVYQYMVCQDCKGKKAMLNAIATILQFSPREKAVVRGILSSGWWGGSGYTSYKSATSKV